MRSFSTVLIALLLFAGLSASAAQVNSAAPAKIPVSGSSIYEPTIALQISSTMNVVSEMGGAVMSGTKCDGDGNLYIRKYATDRPLLGPVVKIDPDGKRVALFDPVAFSQLALDRADAFSPASDGGMYQVAQSGVLKPRIYVLHFSSDGSASLPTLLAADLEVYTFAAFASGNFLVSGVERDLQNKNDRGQNFTAVFSADGRELAELSFEESRGPRNAGAKSGAGGRQQAAAQTKAQTEAQNEVQNDAEKATPGLDLADAEVGSDGNLYVMRRSSLALVYVIAPSGKIMQTLKIAAPLPGTAPSAFHVSGNRLAISFGNEESQSQTIVVADAQTGRKIASYSDPTGLGTSFACYSANEGVFTFLNLSEGNALQVIRAEAQ
ncbi:exported hypothetical protein [Candidatus Sulfotelmatobacter sp. SbA7]|nr:exported hypothetical protein [Candidatus Sulfotelmatobacter sp. SbA7]